MDPITVTISIITLISPFVKKAYDEFAGKAGKVVLDKAKLLYEKLRIKYRDDDEIDNSFDLFEKDPDINSQKLKEVLIDKFKTDSRFCNELSEIINEIKQAGPDIKVVQEIEEAEEMIGIKAKRVKRSKINIKQKVHKGTKITGAEFDEIG